jgi:homoserine O-acetyltransferase
VGVLLRPRQRLGAPALPGVLLSTWAYDHFVFDADPGRAHRIELSYTTRGELDADRGNAVLLPTYYTGRTEDYDGWIGPGLPLDPARWFVVVVDMMGNGRSTSPSTTAASGIPAGGITVGDNVRAQRQLLLQRLGVPSLALVAGWSMGGMQAYEWAARFPHLVRAVLPVCATARCWPLNEAFLAGLVPFLHRPPAASREGLVDFGRAYAAWAYSAVYYRQGLYRQEGHGSAEELRAAWGEDHAGWDPRDLEAMLRTWVGADFTDGERTAVQRLAAITARTVVMPSSTDMYFTPDEAAAEAAVVPGARVETIDSPWGHMAGRPGLLPEVTAQVAAVVRELLAP